MPLEAFQHKDFPWEDAIATKELKHILDPQADLTKALLPALPIGKIILLAPHLDAECLLLMRDHMKNELDFPWSVFFDKPGIAFYLHHYTSQFLLNETPFDPRELAGRKQLLEKLFNTSNENYPSGEKASDFTKNILSHSGYDAIAKLAPDLKLEHLEFFDSKQIAHAKFPWNEFIKKPGIGFSLYQFFDASFLLTTSLPWAEFAAKPSFAPIWR